MIQYIKVQQQRESQEIFQPKQREHRKREKGFKQQSVLRVSQDQKATKSKWKR